VLLLFAIPATRIGAALGLTLVQDSSMKSNSVFDLTGKVALVTGGSRGIGRSIVKGFAEAGADVVITSRKLDSCEEAARDVEALGRRALPIACHVGYWDQVDALVERAYAEFGHIDVLVNNAGMAPHAASSDTTSEALFDKMMDVNFKGPYRLSALVGRRMAEGNGGSIINISSTSALVPRSYDSCYAAAKAALNQASMRFAQEYGPKVRVNVISPGPFLTDISQGWTDEIREMTAKSNALTRAAEPDEMIGTALYLASDASSFTTGTLIRVDGGLR
jgi:NAD(P)-dependent dehydrogenase (short-subunit alcohol dehydrogenase family)